MDCSDTSPFGLATGGIQFGVNLLWRNQIDVIRCASTVGIDGVLPKEIPDVQFSVHRDERLSIPKPKRLFIVLFKKILLFLWLFPQG